MVPKDTKGTMLGVRLIDLLAIIQHARWEPLLLLLILKQCKAMSANNN